LHRIVDGGANVVRDDYRVTMSGPGCVAGSFFVDVSGNAPDRRWYGQSINLRGCQTVKIEPRFIAGRAPNGIDRIELFDAVDMAPLQIGSYHTNDLVRFMDGRNGLVNIAAAQDGRAHRLLSGTFTFDVDPTVRTVILYRHDFAPRDALQMRTLQCPSSNNQRTYVFQNTDVAGTAYSRPMVINNLLGCTRVEVTRFNPSGSVPLMERLVLLSGGVGALMPGMYDNFDLLNFFTNASLLNNFNNPSQGVSHRIEAGGALNFTVNPAVTHMVLYRLMDGGANVVRDDYRVSMSGPGCTSGNFFVDVSGNAPDLRWYGQSIDLRGCQTVKIEPRFIAGRAPNGLDRIELLSAADMAPLTIGTYHTNDLVRFMDGRNGRVNIVAAQDSRAHRLLSGTFTFNVAASVKSVILYRHDYAPRDPLQMRTLQCGNPSNERTYVFQNTDVTGAAYSSPMVITDLLGCTRVEVTRFNPAGSVPLMERLTLVGANTGALAAGEYDNLDLLGYFTNASLIWNFNNASENLSHQMNTGGALNFTVNPAVTHMVLHRIVDGGANPVRDDYRVSMSGPGCTSGSFFVDVSGNAPDLRWYGQSIDLRGCQTVNIVPRFIAGRAPNGLDRIELLTATDMAPLTIGTYHTNDLVRFMDGRNGRVNIAAAQDSRAHRLLSGTFTFNVAASVRTVILYRHDFTPRDPLQMRTLQCGNPSNERTYVFQNTDDTGTAYSAPMVIADLLGCTRVEVTRFNPSWSVPLMERLVLLGDNSGPLAPGMYDNFDLLNFFTNATLLNNFNNPSQGVSHRIDAGGAMNFTVTPSVTHMVLYRIVDGGANPVRDDYRVSMSGPGCTSGNFFVDVSGSAPDRRWYGQSIDLRGCQTVNIEPRFIAGRAPNGLDRIELLDAVGMAPLTIGTYHTSDLVRFMDGRNGQVNIAAAQDGRAHRILSGTFTFNVHASVNSLVLYRHNFNLRDAFQIRTLQCGNPSNERTVVFQNTDVTGLAYSAPMVINNLLGCTRVEVTRFNPAGSVPLLERLELFGTPIVFSSGNTYQESNPGLTYTGTWTTQFNSGSLLNYNASSTQLNSSVSFVMTGNGFVIQHRADSTASNNIEVCVQTGANPSVCTSYSIQSATAINVFPVGIYGLGSGTHTVTITNKQSGGRLYIDAIQIP